MAARTTDGAGIRSNGSEGEAHALEYAHIGVVHLVVAFLGGSLVAVEGIGILHGELAPAHQAETWAAFVAEFRLNVIEIHRQLAPAVDFVTRDVRDDFFRSGLEYEIAWVTILDAQPFRAIFLSAARFLPELGRLTDRHEQFDGAC